MASIRFHRWSGGHCDDYEQWLDDGDTETFDENCTPESCPVAAWEALPHASLWAWFARLSGWREAGYPVGHILQAWPISWVNAFCAFSANLTNELRELQEKERESRAAEVARGR